MISWIPQLIFYFLEDFHIGLTHITNIKKTFGDVKNLAKNTLFQNKSKC